MADRSCAVILVNDTPFQLSLAGRFDLEHGKWEVLPPDIVEPGQKVVWKSASKTAALFGTQGHVEYQIKGSQPGIFFKVKDTPDKPSVSGFLSIDFESPFSGAPHCTANIHAPSDMLEIPNDPNDFYQVMTGFMGRTDDRDFGEELIESLQVGPLEIVLSWLGAPEHHPFFFVRLQMRVPVVDHRKPASLMTDFPDPRPLTMKPVLNGSVEAWIGKWRLTLPDNTLDVRLDISASAGDRSYAISLEDKTRSITAHFKEIPLTRSAIVDYTGNIRKEPPVPVTGMQPSFAKIHLSGIGAEPINTHTETEEGTGLSPLVHRMSRTFETIDLNEEVALPPQIDSLQLSDQQALYLYAFTDLGDPSAIRSYAIQYVEKAGTEMISNLLLGEVSNIH